jgi:hypothetical protein
VSSGPKSGLVSIKGSSAYTLSRDSSCKISVKSLKLFQYIGAKLIIAFGLKSTDIFSSTQVIGQQPAKNASGIFQCSSRDIRHFQDTG